MLLSFRLNVVRLSSTNALCHWFYSWLFNLHLNEKNTILSKILQDSYFYCVSWKIVQGNVVLARFLQDPGYQWIFFINLFKILRVKFKKNPGKCVSSQSRGFSSVKFDFALHLSFLLLFISFYSDSFWLHSFPNGGIRWFLFLIVPAPKCFLHRFHKKKLFLLLS